MNEDRFKGATKEAIGKVESSVGTLAGRSHLEGQGAVDQVIGLAQNTFGQAADVVKDVAGKAQDVAGTAASQGATYMNDRGSALADQIEANPLMTIAASALLGYFVGYLVHRS